MKSFTSPAAQAALQGIEARRNASPLAAPGMALANPKIQDLASRLK